MMQDVRVLYLIPDSLSTHIGIYLPPMKIRIRETPREFRLLWRSRTDISQESLLHRESSPESRSPGARPLAGYGALEL